jgi:trans-aconitate 2-methyltransferase
MLWDHSEFAHKNQLCSSLNAKTTKARLEAAGFGEINTWLHEEPTEFDSMDELASFLKTVVLGNHLERLPESAREHIATMLAAQLEQRGELVVDYVRLNILAKREVAA